MENIVIQTKEGAISEYSRSSCSIRFYIPPYGPDQINETCDCEFPGGFRIPYHYHDQGTETFLVLKGSVEVILNGKRCKCDEGDIINIPAHLPHAMAFEEEAVLRAMFGKMDVMAACQDRMLLAKGGLIYSSDAAFMKQEYGPAHHYFALTEPASMELVEKDSLPQITTKGKAIYEYNGWEGIKCQLKVGRWNLKNGKEIWELRIDRGYQLRYLKPTPGEAVYSVKSGRLMIETDGQIFYADKNDLIHIPQYTPYTLTALSDDAAVYDLNVTTRLLRMLEMLELAQRDEPEKAADPQWRGWLLELNNCGLTGIVNTAFG